jgi:hypothetical protein
MQTAAEFLPTARLPAFLLLRKRNKRKDVDPTPVTLDAALLPGTVVKVSTSVPPGLLAPINPPVPDGYVLAWACPPDVDLVVESLLRARMEWAEFGPKDQGIGAEDLFALWLNY